MTPSLLITRKTTMAGIAILVLAVATLAGAFSFAEPSPRPSDPIAAFSSDADPTPATTIYEGRPFEPSVAVDAADPLHIVAASMDRRQDANGIWLIWLKTHVSRDGGVSWASAEFPGGLSAGPTHPLFAYDEIFDVTVNILPGGTVLLVAMAARQDYRDDGTLEVQYTTAGNIFTARSFDGGETWPDIRILRHGVAAVASARLLHDNALSTGGGAFVSFNDKDWVAVGADGTILLTWADLQFPAASASLYNIDMWHSISRDLGETWSEPRLLVDGGVYPLLPAVLRDGGLRVAFRNLEMGGRWEMISSDDGGGTWTRQEIVPASETGPPGKTTLLGSTLVLQPLAEHDRLFLPFATATSENPTQQLKYIISDDRGATWTAPVSIDEPTDYDRGAAFPLAIGYPSAAAADGAGTIFVTYHHIPLGAETADFKVVRIRDGVASEPEFLDTDLAGTPHARGHYEGLSGTPAGGAYATWVSGGSWAASGPSLLVGSWVSADG